MSLTSSGTRKSECWGIEMTYTLTISDGTHPIAGSVHHNLRDARAALIRYQNNRGLHFTINRWTEGRGYAYQDGVLRTGMQVVGTWTISYPLEREMSA
jgi:hypothetical protein